jgi:hypothetical protein
MTLFSTGSMGSDWRGRAPAGPLEQACQEISLAEERFAIERLRRRRLASLLRRTDQILTELEKLNLQDVKLVSEAGLLELAALVADLPSDQRPVIGRRPSPTTAIDVVFDIQADLLGSIKDAEPGDGELLVTAS